MNKFYGIVGYAETVETSPGVWEEQIIERYHYGNITKNRMKLQSSENLNDNVIFSNDISIVSDPYGRDHYGSIRYVIFNGSKWKVSNVEIQYPRLLLTLGGLYNG